MNVLFAVVTLFEVNLMRIQTTMFHLPVPFLVSLLENDTEVKEKSTIN